MKNLRITKESVYQYLLITLGSLVFALGQLYFIKPLHIPMGGVSGIALVTNYLWNLPIGVVSIVLNIPLFFLGWRTLGRGFFFKTAFGTVVEYLIALTLMLVLFDNAYPPLTVKCSSPLFTVVSSWAPVMV